MVPTYLPTKSASVDRAVCFGTGGQPVASGAALQVWASISSNRSFRSRSRAWCCDLIAAARHRSDEGSVHLNQIVLRPQLADEVLTEIVRASGMAWKTRHARQHLPQAE